MERFEDLITSNIPVLVDFFAEWCGPCKAMKPILEELKGIKGEKVRIVKVDVDKHKEIAAYYQIQSKRAVKVVLAQIQQIPPSGLFTQLVGDDADDPSTGGKTRFLCRSVSTPGVAGNQRQAFLRRAISHRRGKFPVLRPQLPASHQRHCRGV